MDRKLKTIQHALFTTLCGSKWLGKHDSEGKENRL